MGGACGCWHRPDFLGTSRSEQKLGSASALDESYRIVIVVLPHDTIGRILDHANTALGKVGRRRTTRSLAAEAGPALAEDIISALNKATKDNANVVGPLEPSYFNDLSVWCRRVGLTEDGEIVEAAVRASG